MKFYIVTPTFNALTWLHRCIRSVADQVEDGVEVHHHVQDGGSSDGTPAWLEEWQSSHANVPGYTFTYESARDAGMYDALNTAWGRLPSDADVTAHLNSDEQYLSGALKGVSAVFEAHAAAEIISASFVVLDAQSRYICHRRSIAPWRWCSQTTCEIITCSCFHRANSFMKHGIRFDTRFRSIADMVMYRDMVNYGLRIQAVPELLTSVFTVTGDNLGWSEVTQREWEVVFASMPFYAGKLSRLTNKLSCARRRLVDCMLSAPQEYSLYLPGQDERTRFDIKTPTAHWGCRSVAEE